jgi:hypothetical protein
VSLPDLNTYPPEYETGVLITGLWRFYDEFFFKTLEIYNLEMVPELFA